MFKFFRNIRKSLINEGKTTKYIKYAIGEIVLVVIGIMIALEINNWNTNRLENLEEKKILISVKKDLGNTIREFQFLKDIRKKVISASKEIFTLSNSPVIDKLKLDSLLAFTFYRPTFNNTQGTIELLFSSGRINMIENDSIREFLIAWPGNIEDMTEEEVYAMTVFEESYYPLLSKYIVISDVVEKNKSLSVFGSSIYNETFPKIPFKSDYEALLKDKAFYNHLRMRAGHMEITINDCEDLIKKAQTTIGWIDNEIKK